MTEPTPRTPLSAQRLISESIAPTLAETPTHARTDRPLLVLAAPIGSGMSTAFHMTVRAFRRSPCTVVDVGTVPPPQRSDSGKGGVLELLAMIVGGLSTHQKARRFGARRFTAFQVCFALLTDMALDLRGPDRHRRLNRFLRELFFLRLHSVETRLRGLGDTTPTALPGWLSIPLWLGDLLLRLAVFPMYLLWRRKIQRSFDECRRFGESSLTGRLAELWQSHVDNTRVEHAEALLCEVLLADLERYARRYPRGAASLVMVDGVRFDEPKHPSARLMTWLAEIHANHADRSGWGPLIVLASTSDEVDTIGGRASTIDEVLADWTASTKGAGDAGSVAKWTLKMRLPGLTRDDFRRIAGPGYVGPLDDRTIDWALRMAADRIEDVHAMASAMAAHPDARRAVDNDEVGRATLVSALAGNPELAARVRGQTPPARSPGTSRKMRVDVRHERVDRSGVFRPRVTVYQWRRWIAYTAMGLAVVVPAAVTAFPWVDRYFGTCGGDFDVVHAGPDDECVGVTDGSYVFDSGIAEVTRLIKKENDWVASNDKTSNVVSVAYMVPIDVSDERVDDEAIRHQLQGAYLAQREANRNSLNQRRTMIRLLIANTGKDGRQWKPVVEDLVSRKDNPPDRLIAVAGLNSSYTPTFAAMSSLSEHDIPMVGSVMTADDVLSEIGSAFRVAPDNTDEVQALVDYLHSDREVGTAMLIRDTNPEDPYSTTLAAAFTELFPDPEHEIVAEQVYDSSHAGVVESFANMVGNVCFEKPDVIFFAGRGTLDLPDLVTELSQRNCHSRPIRIVTGDDASHFPDMPTMRDVVGKGNLSIEYAGLAHPDQWEPGVDTGELEENELLRHRSAMAEFAKSYEDYFGSRDRLIDGQAIMSYDAVTLTVEAIRLFDLSSPTAGSLQNSLPQLVGCSAALGLTGRLAMTESGDVDNKAIPILTFDSAGSPRVTSVTWPQRNPTPIPDDC
ncbi:ABC transporter substrate-binding protein [Stackebrandtia soli]|uniref:ABC transporter substrate-binding protein n=1 Tax=Stackebrandtia soli TaxID=1892856 RepID=UPI0039EB2A8B